jgi:hypothetical protein
VTGPIAGRHVTEPVAEPIGGPIAESVVRPVPGAGETGHPDVDTALAELARAERLPPDQQIAAYESVHRTLQDTLRTIEQS